MKSSEIREKFLKYFESKNHTRVASSSLIPENDPTILFTNAGMNQFKNAFLGLEKRPYVRAVSSQKCVRAGGKHNDLENVGFTARHHTFFEMLGNFSFGEYFKKDAIHFAWEFLTQELKIPKEKLYVTVYKDDDEAADIWHNQEKVPRDRIFRLDQDNFWRMGDVGPCGPSSEIFYDHGERAGRETDPFKGIVAGEDRFVEIWNLVFMQFEEKSPGVMEKLPKPSVDTGSGLERVAAAMQGKLNNYDTDLFWPLIVKTAELSKQTQLLPLIEEMNLKGIHSKISDSDKKKIAALRVVADHTRSATFLIADGVLPSNEGRGYVLRRILRRGIRYCQNLSGGNVFFPEVSEVLIQTMSEFYPELKHRKDVILTTIQEEQKKFVETLKTGTDLLQAQFQKNQSSKVLPGEVVFKLYDTYGFPVDLTRLMADEIGFKIDESGFEKILAESKIKSKASWKTKGLNQNETHLVAFVEKFKSEPTKFLGYDTLTIKTEILGLSNGEKEVDQLIAGQSGFLVTRQTPFYAEGGGQAGDLGTITTASAGSAQVVDCTKKNNIFLHSIYVESGAFKKNDSVTLTVSSSERLQTAVHHSATHLLHAALRKVLGNSITQAGQMVDHQRIRFDFTHSKPVTSGELEQIDNLVNAEISKGNAVNCEVMSPDAAIKKGAMALFGEKYGSEVRVLTMGDFSMELCGGTHVSNTAQIRGFKIMSENGVSAGVRRIEALAGEQLFKLYQRSFDVYSEVKNSTGAQESWSHLLEETQSSVPQSVDALKAQIKNLEKELKGLKLSKLSADDFIATSRTTSTGTKFVCSFADTEDRDLLSKLGDQIRDKLGTAIVIIVGAGSESKPVLVTVSKDLVGKYKAGDILKSFVTPLGGKGGGRPDFAQGSVAGNLDIKKITSEFSL